MKKFGKIFLLTLVVVGLVISFVGCAGLEGGNQDGLEKTKKYDLTWKEENDGTTQYTRFYKQFGSVETVSDALVEITAKKPENGWSGMVFGLTKNKEKNEAGNNTVNFFVLAMRTYSGVPNYYLSYFPNVDPDDIQDKATFSDDEIELIATQAIPSNFGFSVADDGSLTSYVRVTVSEEGEGTDLIVKAGADEENLYTVMTIDATEYMGEDIDNAKAGIGAYGQITTGTAAEPKDVETRYYVIESTPARGQLVAVEE